MSNLRYTKTCMDDVSRFIMNNSDLFVMILDTFITTNTIHLLTTLNLYKKNHSDIYKIPNDFVHEFSDYDVYSPSKREISSYTKLKY